MLANPVAFTEHTNPIMTGHRILPSPPVKPDNHQELRDLVYKAPNSIDQLLSKELMQLSLMERNVIEEEIHGVSTLAANETPHLLKTSLQELSRELAKIPAENKAAYAQSQILPQTYVNTPDFRLRFLRCELFDAKKAAIRMTKYLDFALYLYGPIVLRRPMRLSDFTKEEKKWLGCFQPLPYRDRSGRLIHAWVDGFNLQEKDLFARCKVGLYLRYCFSDDLEAQRNGFVNLIWIGSNELRPEWKYIEFNAKLIQSTPVRQCAVHWCVPSGLPLTHPINILRCGHTLALGKTQSRVKFHVGERVELLYRLQTYGIPTDHIPVTETDNVKTTYVKQWMRGRQRIEEIRSNRTVVLWPGSKDVIFRGGKRLNFHPGNAMFDGIIEDKLKEHNYANYKEKIAITKAMIDTVHDQGGRFLEWEEKNKWWKELNDASIIHSKVASKIRKATSRSTTGRCINESSTFVFSNQDNVKRRKVSGSDGCDCSYVNCTT